MTEIQIGSLTKEYTTLYLKMLSQAFHNVLSTLKNQVDPGQIADFTIALSPGFFPSEYWADCLDIFDILYCSTMILEPIDPEQLQLKPGSGKMLQDKKGKYWHILYEDQHVGKIYIDYFNNEVLGRHPAIEIFINKNFQGRHIGRYAYALACEHSKLKKIYMHARKSNVASIRAATDAGFEPVESPLFKQVVMIWHKKRKN